MAKPTNNQAGPRAATGDRSAVPGETRRSAAAGSPGARTAARGRISTPTARTTQAARTAAAGNTTQSRTAPGRTPGASAARTSAARASAARASATRSTSTAQRDGRAKTEVGTPRAHPDGRNRPPWRPVNLAAPAKGARPMSPSTRRMYRRRRRSMVLALLLVAVIALLASQFGGPDTDESGASAAVPTLRPAVPTAAQAKVTTAPKVRQDGVKAPATTAASRTPVRTTVLKDNGFDYAPTAGPVLGTSGSLRRFKVAVEQGQGQDPAEFAAAIDRILGDPRSWIAVEQFRLQRVSRVSGAEFTVFLASAATSEKMCAKGGLRTAGFTSCRLAGRVIINLDRWKKAVPDYGAPLATYQAYAINHEVGHQFGHGHEACPGAGRPAPVMQQQTYGLKGCTANAWPYVNGKRYAGSPVD